MTWGLLGRASVGALLHITSVKNPGPVKYLAALMGKMAKGEAKRGDITNLRKASCG